MVLAVGATHHIKLGDYFFLIRQGTYRKRPAPLFGSRFSTGDPDYNNLSFWQHWVQTCWVGGFGAETWQDDAMFDEGVGVNTTQHEVMVLTRDLSKSPLGELDTATNKIRREFFDFGNDLHVVSYSPTAGQSKLYRWNAGVEQRWELYRTFPGQVRSVAEFGGFVFFGDTGPNFEKMDANYNWSTLDKPDIVEAHTPYSMQAYRGRLYVGFGNQVWRVKTDPGSGFLWDGSTGFYTAEDVDYIIAMEKHLGFLYMVSNNGHVLRTDGNNTFDIWQFDVGIRITSLRSFDGRLFISTTEALEGSSAQQTVLYQFTGAAVTELKRWGMVGRDISTGRMRVYNNRLIFGAGAMLGMGDAVGFGVAAYDPREDSYHAWATNRDGTTFPGGTEGVNWTVDDVVFWHGWVWASVRGHGIYRCIFSYKDVTRYLAKYDVSIGGGLIGPMNGGWFTSSDFDAGTPGMLKMFNAITVHVDLPTVACSALVEYSMDGGVSWGLAGANLANATIGGPTHPTEIGRVRKTIKFQGGGLRGTRLKYRITLKTTDVTRSPALRGVIVRYLPLPEPGWMWEFDVVLADRMEQLDGKDLLPGVKDLSNWLDSAYRAQQLLHFTDIDGAEWTAGEGRGVLMYDFEKQVPFAGPDSDGPIEAVYRVTLLEAVEAY